MVFQNSVNNEASSGPVGVVGPGVDQSQLNHYSTADCLLTSNQIIDITLAKVALLLYSSLSIAHLNISVCFTVCEG